MFQKNFWPNFKSSFENSHNYINMSTFERRRDPNFSQASFWQFLSSHAAHLLLYIITWVVVVIVLNNNFNRLSHDGVDSDVEFYLFENQKKIASEIAAGDCCLF